MFGISVKDIPGQRLTDFIAPEHQAEFAEFILKAPEGTLRHLALKKKGTVFTAETNVRIIPSGKTMFRVITINDVSEQLNAEKIRVQDIDRMETLLELNRMIDLSPGELYHLTLEKVVWLTESTLGFVGSISPDEKEMIMEAWSTDVMKECKMTEQPQVLPVENAGLWAEVIRQRRPIIINHYNDEKIVKNGIPAGHVSLNRFLGVPVFDKGRIVLIACVANKKNPYEVRDAQQLTLVMDGLWRVLQRKKAEEMLSFPKRSFAT
jgi:hypothetical protein